jgi:hypothetical protein
MSEAVWQRRLKQTNAQAKHHIASPGVKRREN